jgi:hypothetical protein
MRTLNVTYTTVVIGHVQLGSKPLLLMLLVVLLPLLLLF